MTILKVVVAVIVLMTFAVADDKLPPKVVRVIGTAEVKVIPDRAVIEIGVAKQSPDASTAKQSADAAARKILSALRGSGVEEKDIRTTFLSLQPQFDYRKGMRISYFAAEQTLSVTVRDLSSLDKLLDSLIKAGGNRVDSVQYETSDLRKYRDEARELAVKACREKAQALAKALGQEIGKAYSVEEVPESSWYSGGLLSNVAVETETPKRRAPATAAGQRTVTASIVVSFELN